MTKDAWAAALVLAALDHEHGDSALLQAIAHALSELDEAKTLLLDKGYGDGYGRINWQRLAEAMPERQT